MEDIVKWLERHGTGPGSFEERLCEAARLIQKHREALAWCSGSADFGPGGQAEEGWDKDCRPLLDSDDVGGGFVQGNAVREHELSRDCWCNPTVDPTDA